MPFIDQTLSSARSILISTTAGAAIGAWSCAVGGGIIGSAVPSVATGALALGVGNAISRTVVLLNNRIGNTDSGKNPLIARIRTVTSVASIPLSLYAGALAATALGFPITFKATILVLLGGIPSIALVTIPLGLGTAIYITRNGVPQFVNNAFNEALQNTNPGPNRDLLIIARRLINQLDASLPHQRRV